MSGYGDGFSRWTDELVGGVAVRKRPVDAVLSGVG
jgi:hypothetical protein